MSDLARARKWYDTVLDRAAALEPVAGIVEYELAGTWIQLVGNRAGVAGWVLRYGVEDLTAERARLCSLGIEVSPIEKVPGVIAFCSFADPDGNRLSSYQVLSAAS